MNRDSEISDLERSLKGAPAAIFLALVLHGGPQTTKTLCRHTGYSDKVIRQGLARLRTSGLVFNDPDLRAWYLVRGTQLLILLQEALSTAVGPGLSAIAAGEQRVLAANRRPPAGQLSTDLSTGASVPMKTEDISAEADVIAAEDRAGEADAFETAGLPICETEKSSTKAGVSTLRTEISSPPIIGADRISPGAAEESNLVAEVSAAEMEIQGPQAEEYAPSRARILTTTTATHQQSDQEKESKHTKHKRAQAPSRPLNRRQSELAAWLVRGGIGPTSPKMFELLESELDLRVVKAHVLERKACEAGLVSDRQAYPVGLLIRKLLDGDPPPPLRCERCLHLITTRLGWCGCDFEAVIKR